QDYVQQFAGELQLIGAEANLLQLQDGIREECVVIEICVQMCAAVIVGREEPAIAPERTADEPERALRGRRQVVAAERPRCDGHASDHQAVPGSEDLVVASRTDSVIPYPQQL